jgi:hypothetical protein
MDAMRAQDCRCAICATYLIQGDANADHDHATGVARGLLCGPCNRGIGHFQDDPARLRAAADYIERHRGR